MKWWINKVKTYFVIKCLVYFQDGQQILQLLRWNDFTVIFKVDLYSLLHQVLRTKEQLHDGALRDEANLRGYPQPVPFFHSKCIIRKYLILKSKYSQCCHSMANVNHGKRYMTQISICYLENWCQGHAVQHSQCSHWMANTKIFKSHAWSSSAIYPCFRDIFTFQT